jgi:hypothetical protein
MKNRLFVQLFIPWAAALIINRWPALRAAHPTHFRWRNNGRWIAKSQRADSVAVAAIRLL